MKRTTRVLQTLKKYWYYIGDWHNAGCDFIQQDRGVCNCNYAKNKKKIIEALEEGGVDGDE